jgi:hypothetical protein
VDLKEISKKTGVPLRKLRYVVDHGIAPKSNVALRGNGLAQPRLYTDSGATLVLIGGAILEAGVKRELASQMVLAVCELQWKRGRSWRSVLESVVYESLNATLTVADGSFLKLDISERKWSSGWLEIDSLEQSDFDGNALVLIQIDLGTLAGKVRGDLQDEKGCKHGY